MYIAPLNNTMQTQNFRGYGITELGKQAVKELSTVAEKERVMQFCEYFKDKKHVDVIIDQDLCGRLDVGFKVPQEPDTYIWSVHSCEYPRRGAQGLKLFYYKGPVNGGHCDDTAHRYFNLYTNSYCQLENVHNALVRSAYQGTMNRLDAYELFGDIIEEAEINRLASLEHNKKVDEFFG